MQVAGDLWLLVNKPDLGYPLRLSLKVKIVVCSILKVCAVPVVLSI